MIYIFDLDGTLTESRSEITPEMLLALKELTSRFIVGITSGAELARMNIQIPDILSLHSYIMPQSANIVYEPDGNKLWEYKITEEELVEALAHIAYIKKTFPVTPVTSEQDTVQNRGSQISYNAFRASAVMVIFSPFATRSITVKISVSDNGLNRNTAQRLWMGSIILEL